MFIYSSVSNPSLLLPETQCGEVLLLKKEREKEREKGKWDQLSLIKIQLKDIFTLEKTQNHWVRENI